jgi:formylglycine-generating enzyme required for sulfatase activity
MTRVAIAALIAGCAGAPAVQAPAAARAAAPLSLAADERIITVPAGQFIAGSTPEERAAAYDDFQRTADRDTARAERWFEAEADRHAMTLPAFRIDLMPVTQAQYAEFVTAEHAAPPSIDDAGWQAEGLAQDAASLGPRFVWSDGRPPGGREDHPVVLVAWTDAGRYCAWRGALRGQRRRLPTADELEKAMRGDAGMAYPWGGAYEPDKLNSAVQGPGDTTPVGAYPAGASPYGVLDLAGNVRHWSSTPSADGQVIVKGASWRDLGGIGRGAWFDRRPRSAREVGLGFRCAGDVI